MSKTYRPYDPGQQLLLSAALQKLLLICAGHNLLKLFRFGANLPGRKRGNGPAGAAGELRRAVITPMIRKLTQRGHSASA